MGVDVDTLEKVNDDINKSGFSGTFVTVPVVDGDLIIERPIETIIKGKLNAVSGKLSYISTYLIK